MKSKEKTKNNKLFKLTLKNIILFFGSIIILFYIYTFYHLYFRQNMSYAKDDTKEVTTEPESIKISNAENVNIDDIINKNYNPNYREEIMQEEQVLEYLTTYKENYNIPKGISYVTQEGRKGTQKITIKRIYDGENLVSEEQIGAVITKAALNKVIEIGKGKTTSTKKVKVGDIVYVTSDMLAVMSEASEDSEKILTLTTNDELEVLEIKDSWYKVAHSKATGWVKKECTTYIDLSAEEEIKQEESNSLNQTESKSQVQSLSFNMQLNKPSGLSLEQFKKVLSDKQDVNKVFENNAEYFYYIEQQYNINGIFVAAVGIHESAWGTSTISKQKHNLFGYGAYDSNPYNGAYSFSDYSESIDLIARVFVKYYLNPKGTNIYGGEKAAGSYYTSPTLTGVNNKYASDKNWANAVYKHMQYLYSKL